MTTDAPTDQVQITVIVDKVRYTAEGRSIVVCHQADGRSGTFDAKIPLGPVSTFMRLVLAGRWVSDPKWGRQLDAYFACLAAPSTPRELDQFLASGLVDGWGEEQISALYAHPQRNQLVELVRDHPEQLIGYGDIDANMVSTLTAAWHQADRMLASYAWLASHDLTGKVAQNLIKQHGAGTQTVLEQDPYADIFDVALYGWRRADALGKQLEIVRDDPRRVNAGLAYAVQEETWKAGHTWLTYGDACDATAAVLNLHTDQVGMIVDASHDLGQLHYGDDRVYPIALWDAEQAIGGAIASRCDRVAWDLRYDVPRPDYADTLTPQQWAGVEMALNATTSLLTGGPGVGKTSTIKGAISAARQAGLPVTLMAPTGKAAMRMAQATGHAAGTIHSKLGLVPGSTNAGVNRELLTGLVVVDEVSMLDTTVAAAVFEAVASDAHLLLVGDPDQLPSVGPGAILRDLIASDVLPRTHLDKVFRNAGGIAENAARMRRGESLVSTHDCRIISADTSHSALQVILSLLGEHTDDDCLVLTPTNGGAVGRFTLNATLQDAIGPHEDRYGTTVSAYDPSRQEMVKQYIFPGDKIMVTKNDRDLGVWNGQTGIALSCDPKRGIEADLDGHSVFFRGEAKNLLTLAYAITGHKSQGSEAPVVIIPVFPSRVLSREWLYTCLTRAREQVYLVGDPGAMQSAINTVRVDERRTGLVQAIREACGQ